MCVYIGWKSYVTCIEILGMVGTSFTLEHCSHSGFSLVEYYYVCATYIYMYICVYMYFIYTIGRYRVTLNKVFYRQFKYTKFQTKRRIIYLSIMNIFCIIFCL